MPFRARLKQVFKGHSSSSSSGSVSSGSQSQLDWRNDSTVYAPGEPMPRPKYRLPVDKKHKKSLDTWQWGKTLQRMRSRDSLYSPGGTRMPSRNVSRNASRTASRSSSRRSSVESLRRPQLQRGRSGFTSGVDLLAEDSDEQEQLANVTLSRPSSRPHSPAPGTTKRTGPRRHVHLSEKAQASVTRAANKGREGKLAPPSLNTAAPSSATSSVPTMSTGSTEPETPLSPDTPMQDMSDDLERKHTAEDHKAFSEQEIQEALAKLASRSGALTLSSRH